MEPLTILVDELKRLATTAQDLAHSLLNSGRRRSPIDILKRLQREAFSDIMKLRDRQDKVERLLTFYKSSKGSPFQESGTHVRGNVDVLGAFFVMDGVDEQKYDAVQRSAIRNGIDARLRFETDVREKDKLVAEFSANGKGQGDMLGGSLSLAKILYAAHFSDWFSAVAIPMGAQCRDVAHPTSTHQERGVTSYSDSGPPFLYQHSGSAIGIAVRKMNIVASMAQFVSNFSMQDDADGLGCSLSTLGQIVWDLSRNTKLSLLGVHRVSQPSGQNINLGALAFPLSRFRRYRFSETSAQEEDQPIRNSNGSIALMLNSEIEDSTRIGGWIETKNSNPGHLQWAVTMSDTPEDELGWGLTLGGMLQGPKRLQHFQMETFLNMNFGKRFTLRPGLVYVKDGVTQFPALTIHSSWSL
ncbi:uncharacterized protein LOC121782078 isoform X1 [Salvia splendens]|uniref:uncharacterized protein LOC121782078 isoform X1 n=2 Tax=Salvia splendens TaxID=180675 RepID=UPI0011004A5A|nr:uncharacterized protein LOC121782078 isoform X1 [Salvia splendens]XP_042035712.1 uncharacterized protein LOC121782078 isoform X1 [Salvia splendens]XP_042035713.1 uncharacterized protein LOC121782078 isoform X1 [Salvia splendens]XP_042035714.1 uncharacterized protein LOC121782078 isoform X1 [Salvia splendens]